MRYRVGSFIIIIWLILFLKFNIFFSISVWLVSLCSSIQHSGLITYLNFHALITTDFLIVSDRYIFWLCALWSFRSCEPKCPCSCCQVTRPSSMVMGILPAQYLTCSASVIWETRANRECNVTVFHASQQRDFVCLLPRFIKGQQKQQQLDAMCLVWCHLIAEIVAHCSKALKSSCDMSQQGQNCC